MTTLEERLQRLEDLEAIRQLDAKYCRLLDGADWRRLTQLFMPNGEFIGLDRVRGHEALHGFFAGLADGGGLTAFWHYVTNLEIELDGDSAQVRSVLWQPCVQDGVPHVAAGRYRDHVMRHDGRWRYRSKEIMFDYFAPLTEGWEPGRFTLEAARQTAGESL